jgi:hypothetical protein
MKRAEITKFLSDLLVKDKLAGLGNYYASEVSFFWGRKNAIRVDFLKFEPENQTTSGIEKGVFTSYEVKSSVADFRSKNGHNFIAEKNYYVMPMEVYKKVLNDIPAGIGVYCPIPAGKSKVDEFEQPTNLDSLPLDNWELKNILPAFQKDRQISMSTILFCMLRSGK